MERNERLRIHATSEEAASWVAQARSILERRSMIEKAGKEAVASLRRRVVEVRREEGVAWRVVPLRPADTAYLNYAARQARLPAVGPEERKALYSLTTDVATAVNDAKGIIGMRRFFLNGKKRETGAGAAAFLIHYCEWALAAGVPQLLDRLDCRDDGPSEIPLTAALADWVGLGGRLADLGSSQRMLPVAAVAHLPRAVEAIDAALRREEHFRANAVAAGEAVRKHEVRRLLADMPVERLKEATRDRLRIGPLTEAGLNTVQAVLERGSLISHLPGIGATTATRKCAVPRKHCCRRRTMRRPSGLTSRAAHQKPPSCFDGSRHGTLYGRSGVPPLIWP